MGKKKGSKKSKIQRQKARRKVIAKRRIKKNKPKPRPDNQSVSIDDPMSIWNNPMFNTSNVDQSYKDYMAEIGEQMYDFDYEGTCANSEMDLSKPPPENSVPTQNEQEELAVYLYNYVKAGLHPSHLTDNEKEAMKEKYGANWYKRLGYQSQ